ncbi:DUF3891 family protein [Halorubrum sp. JWXQ-INN 858]|uniref:DUF3891 family protein n=1 Tax=Halorubrum sp. JWXQ-INN 858 TaxID=2690782 RepID=UPI0013599AFE|nr:DUF3891 family protein [Halorubrum sp. JWXQ-INN 858]MWV65724.1 DUF3891 family protein [Halorubrum sp. JWXQ-INN 858]
MILARTDDGIRFVTQSDHAALAGRLAEQWGGAGFAPPEPTAAVRLAVHAHDDGWWTHDRRPRLRADGSPQDFHELPPSRWTRLYRRGIDGVARTDRYAGLLVSVHGSGLRRRRYGLSPSWGETPRSFRGFVEREERRQRSLATALRADPDDDRLTPADVAVLTALHDDGRAPADLAAESRLWRNYRLLSALDALSLRICATAGTEDTLPEPITVDRVPTEPGNDDATLTAAPVGPGAYRIDPYPFRDVPVTVNVPARTVEETTFPDEETLLARYYGSDVAELAVTLRPADGTDRGLEGDADGTDRERDDDAPTRR